MRLLFVNKVVEDVIYESYSETDIRQNNIAIVLLALFILWD